MTIEASSEEIIDIVSQARDLQGNSIQYTSTATGEYNFLLAGKDGKLGSSSDINNNGIYSRDKYGFRASKKNKIFQYGKKEIDIIIKKIHSVE